MSIWGTIIGAGLAPFTGGASLAIGAAIDQGINSNKAAKEAAAVQTAAGDKALAFQQQAYADQKAALNPFVQTGQAAVRNLGDLLHLPPPKQNMSGTGQGIQTQPAPPGLQMQSNTLGAIAGQSPPVQPVEPNFKTARSQFAQGQPVTGQPNPTASSFVTMKAPTGEVAQVPANELPHWLSLGATQVNTLGAMGGQA